MNFKVVKYGLSVEVVGPIDVITLAVMALISPGRSDVPDGSSFAYVSGAYSPGQRGLALSAASARFLIGIDGFDQAFKDVISTQMEKVS